eukprot:CAMPEP_0169453028 /NCGR_PEP_ID=MMETSP1042-20121227/14549_1 /TAXON_ID=464988 /ORGANISM="Hemiselmis andersenii, Strain CCMP1180" /LENGTH=312 /DNA_ID=CAMNT_0009565053 /DNA_START=25 /DNA_END=960 /DNA_ORIENTATION=+
MKGFPLAFLLLVVDLVLALPARGGSTCFVNQGILLSPLLSGRAVWDTIAQTPDPPPSLHPFAAPPLGLPGHWPSTPLPDSTVRESPPRKAESLPTPPPLVNKPFLSQRDLMSPGGGPGGGLIDKEEQSKQEYAVTRGKAIDTLLQDMPYIFDTTPDFSIYRDDICLRDSAGFSASGITPYKMFFSALRMVVPMIYQKAIVSVHLMNKYYRQDDEGRIRLRWKVELFREDDGDQETVEERRKREALQRLGFEVPCSGHHAPEEDKGDRLIEGISVYHLDEVGKVYRHTIESTEPTNMAEAYAKLGLIGATPAT